MNTLEDKIPIDPPIAIICMCLPFKPFFKAKFSVSISCRSSGSSGNRSVAFSMSYDFSSRGASPRPCDAIVFGFSSVLSCQHYVFCLCESTKSRALIPEEVSRQNAVHLEIRIVGCFKVLIYQLEVVTVKLFM